jgi:MFS family permease
LFTAALFFWINMSAQTPVFPLYIQSIGANQSEVGVIMGAFAIGLVISRPRLGQMADHHSRIRVLRIGIIVAIIAPLLYITSIGLPQLFAIRVFHGISIAAFTTGYISLVTDIAPADQRGEVFSYMSLATPLGLGLGPLVGEVIYDTYGVTYLWILCSLLCGLSFCLSLPVQDIYTSSKASISPTTKTASPVAKICAKSTQTSQTSQKIGSILREPRLRVPTIIMTLAGLILGILITFLPLLIDSLSIPFRAGWFFSGSAVASFAIRPFVGANSDRYGRGPFVCLALLAYIISMFILSQASTNVAFLSAGLLEGLGAGCLLPTVIALVSDRGLPQERGRLMALCIGGFDLGMAIAGPIFGSSRLWLSYSHLFLVAAVIGSLALVIFLTANSQTIRLSLLFACGKTHDRYAISEIAASYPNSNPSASPAATT